MSNKINILLLNYEYPPLGGGAGNATYYLLKEFAKMPDLNITLVTSSTGAYRKEEPAPGVTIIYLNIGKSGSLHYQSSKDLLTYSWKAWRFCHRFIKRNQVDLIHAFFGIPCGFIAMFFGKPYIVSLRGSDVPFHNRRFYWLDRFIFKNISKLVWRKAEKVIANSEGLKEMAQKSLPDLEISVIHNGVNINEFHPPRVKKTSQNLRLISTGRLIEIKGYSYLIEALKGLENVQLTLIGDGDQKEQLQAMAYDNNVDVTFAGMVDHEKLPGHLQDADIFILPSLNEGMSNSILEAMACSLPVIVTDTGGARELVKNNGCIVSKQDAKGLKSAILSYICGPRVISEDSKNSLNIAKRMSWSKVAADYRKTYDEIINNLVP